MIHESWFWKKELYNLYQVLYKAMRLKRFGNASYIKVEKAVILSAYIIRKLYDSQKLPPDFLSHQIEVSSFPNLEPVDFLNTHRLNENYNFINGINEKRKYDFIINQVIHSFVFTLIFTENNRLSGILVNSDTSKNRALFEIDIYEYIKLILSVSEGDLTSSRFERIGDERIQTEGVYSYSLHFDINTVITNLKNGNIYKRYGK